MSFFGRLYSSTSLSGRIYYSTGLVAPWTPDQLFAQNEVGAWYDPSDLTTLFQDSAGTTPVTAVGQRVGLLLDKSRGLSLGAELATNGDFSSGTGWTTAAGVTISGGAASFVGVSTSSALFRAASVSIGVWYKVTVVVTEVSAGLLQPRLFGGLLAPIVIVAPGTYTFIDTPTTSNVNIGFVANGFSGVVDSISVQQISGNHATQSTLAQQPLYAVEPVTGRRNLLTYTEQFDNAAWNKNGATITANSIIAPDGTTTAEKVVETATTAIHGFRPPESSKTTETLSIYAKEAERRHIIFTMGENNTALLGGGIFVDLRDGTVLSAAGAKLVGYSVTDAGGGWYRLAITVNSTGAATDPYPFIWLSDNETHTVGLAYGAKIYAGDGTSGIYVWGAQLETGSTATAYQRVVSAQDVSEAGVAPRPYLFFDGIDDGMLTGTITPGADKAQVFAGVRKNSNANSASFFEGGTLRHGVFAPRANGGAEFGFNSGAVGVAEATTTNIYLAGTNYVVAALGDIPADSALIRVNGTQTGTSATDQGAGNYNTTVYYIGRRGGTTLPFSGHLYGAILRFSGSNLGAAQIAATERWMNSKTGAF